MPKIGTYDLYAVEAGSFGLDGGAMFGIVPRTLWERRIAPDARNRIPLATRCLLLVGDGRVILVDNGIGNKYDAKFADLFAIDQSRDDLHGSLDRVGITAHDVTDVVLTHLHFDHCGGSVERNGSRLEPAFPNAIYHVQKAHWFWAEASNAREKASFLAENLEPLGLSGQLNLLDGGGTLFPGVSVMVVDGHTRAQQLVKVEDSDQTLLFAADLLPTQHHLRLPWIMAYDLYPMTTLEEKEHVLTTAVREGWKLFFEHDPDVQVADLVETDRGIIAAGQRTLAEL